MSIIIKINKLINIVIPINLSATYTSTFFIIVFKFHILTTFFTYDSCIFFNLLTTKQT